MFDEIDSVLRIVVGVLSLVWWSLRVKNARKEQKEKDNEQSSN